MSMDIERRFALIDEPRSIITVPEDLHGPPCSKDHAMSLVHELYVVLPWRLAE